MKTNDMLGLSLSTVKSMPTLFCTLCDANDKKESSFFRLNLQLQYAYTDTQALFKALYYSEQINDMRRILGLGNILVVIVVHPDRLNDPDKKLDHFSNVTKEFRFSIQTYEDFCAEMRQLFVKYLDVKTRNKYFSQRIFIFENTTVSALSVMLKFNYFTLSGGTNGKRHILSVLAYRLSLFMCCVERESSLKLSVNRHEKLEYYGDFEPSKKGLSYNRYAKNIDPLDFNQKGLNLICESLYQINKEFLNNDKFILSELSKEQQIVEVIKKGIRVQMVREAPGYVFINSQTNEVVNIPYAGPNLKPKKGKLPVNNVGVSKNIREYHTSSILHTKLVNAPSRDMSSVLRSKTLYMQYGTNTLLKNKILNSNNIPRNLYVRNISMDTLRKNSIKTKHFKLYDILDRIEARSLIYTGIILFIFYIQSSPYGRIRYR